MKVGSEGYVNYYTYELQEQGEQLVLEIDYLQKENSDLLVRATQGLFGLKRKRLAQFFGDCPILVQKIQSKEFKYVFEIVDFYNNWKSDQGSPWANGFTEYEPQKMDTLKNDNAKNCLGTQLQPCCFGPKTGFYRDGFCKTGEEDYGTHVVCAIMTDEFLEYTKTKGNDLSTPKPEWQFPGLKPGDKWCLCILRWLEAEKAGRAPNIVLEATHQKALEYTDFETLLEYKL